MKVINETHRSCNKCSTIKPWSEFNNSKCSKTGKDSICRDCRKEMFKKYNYGINSKENLKSDDILNKEWAILKRNLLREVNILTN